MRGRRFNTIEKIKTEQKKAIPENHIPTVSRIEKTIDKNTLYRFVLFSSVLKVPKW